MAVTAVPAAKVAKVAQVGPAVRLAPVDKAVRRATVVRASC